MVDAEPRQVIKAAGRGNKYAQKHGGAAGVKALSKGEPFQGLALEAEHQVNAELAEIGPGGMARRDAIRLEAVATCYYQHLLGETDPDKLTSLVKTWGWIQNSALRAWQYVADQEAKQDKGISAVDILDAIRGDTDGSKDT